MENYKIYALKLKDNDNIKYIGFTSRNLEDRFKEHLYITINRKYKNGYWIKKHKDNIEIILIEDNIKSIKDYYTRRKDTFYVVMINKLFNDIGDIKRQFNEQRNNSRPNSIPTLYK